MTVVLNWLAQQTLPIYIVSFLGVAAYVAAALAAQRRQRLSQFSLERDINRQQALRFWVMAGLFLMLGVLVFGVTSYFVPTLPAVATETPVVGVGLTAVPTMTSTPTITPTPSPTSELTGTPGAEEQDEPSPTPSPTPEAVETAVPPDCPSLDVQISLPLAGSNLSGLVEVRGTARVNSFAYYKFEVQFPGSDSLNFIAQFESPVENGILGYWDVSNTELYPSGGPYRFRLVTVDVYGNATSCIIPVYLTQ